MEYTKGKRSLTGQDENGAVNVFTDKEYIATFRHKADAQLDAAAPELFEACKYLPEPKSILAEAAYTGGDVPKKWIAERGQFIDGYNQALKDVAKHLEPALSKAEGK